MEKNMVSITKATISFIIWEILFEIIFFMLIGLLSGILMMTIDNEITTNLIMIMPKVLAQFLVIKFAIWNTFKKQTIESSDENKLFINICIIFIAITLFSIVVSFNLTNIIGNLISLLPLLLVKKYISEYNN